MTVAEMHLWELADCLAGFFLSVLAFSTTQQAGKAFAESSPVSTDTFLAWSLHDCAAQDGVYAGGRTQSTRCCVFTACTHTQDLVLSANTALA